MAIKRGRTVSPIRESADVGPDYPDELYRNPVSGDLDSSFGDKGSKAICSPNGTTFDNESIPLHHSYDSNWPSPKGRK